MTRLDRRLLFTSGAAAALLAATGVSAQPRPKRGGRLVAALSGASRSDRWGEAEGLFMQAAQGAVFETLTEIAADGTLRADVAEGWHSADGGLTWVFELSENVMFHDAQPLVSEDVATLFSRHDVLDVKSVQIVSEQRIAVTLNSANSSLPYTLADPQFVILPASAARQEAGIGTGLYRLQKFHAGRQFIGTRVEQHRKDAQAGWFDQVEFVSIPSASVRAEALRDGLIDVADVEALDPYADVSDFQFLPSGQLVQQIARKSVQVPVTVGEVWPLDNMRMAQRWWSA